MLETRSPQGGDDSKHTEGDLCGVSDVENLERENNNLVRTAVFLMFLRSDRYCPAMLAIVSFISLFNIIPGNLGFARY